MWDRQALPPLLLLLLVQLTSSYVAAVQLQTCIDGFVVHRDKIIRTEDSLKLGAVYLSEYEVNSKLECIKWCCETERCDVFVHEDRISGGCYLFHCGPPHDFKCKFTNHANYSSAVLTNYKLQSVDAIDELKSLRKTLLSSTTTTSTTTSSTTSVSPSSSTSSQIAKVSSCSRNQFECRSNDDCIAIYNVCDGIPQCADGSDEALELGCPQERSTIAPPAVQPHHQSQQPSLPDLAGYRQMMHQQQYPMRLYPPPEAGAAVVNQESAWANYQPRGYLAPPVQQQQQQQQQAPNQWPAGPVAPWPPASVDEQKLAMPPVNNHAHAFQPDSNSQLNYPPQQQMPRIFNHKAAGNLPLQQQIESANGLYPQDPNRSYAAYYPNVIPHADSSWQEASNDNVLPPVEGQQQQQQNVIRGPAATAAAARENVPYTEPKVEQQRPSASTSPPPCDSSELKQPEQQQQQQQQPRKQQAAAPSKASPKPATHNEHGAHELQLKTVAQTQAAQAQLQQHNSISIADQLSIARISPRLEDLEMSRPKGAVISLGLGLSVTAIMAVLIACRLRVVKRRGRGRSHDSYAHDTDYLVNGMYL